MSAVLKGSIAAAVVIAVGFGGYILLGNQTPTDEEVRQAVVAGLPSGASILTLEHETFPNDRSSGRVSVTGTYNLSADLYSYPSPPNRLLASLAAAGVYDQDLAAWWEANASFFPQFDGQLAESEIIYSKGAPLSFDGELSYMATVDGVTVDSGGLEPELIEGVSEIQFGYIVDEQLIGDISTQVVEWRDRQRAEQAAAERAALEAARAQAATDAAAEVAAREAERLATERTDDLPTSVVVPHCDDGWSEAIVIPAGWNVQSDWPARSVPYQLLDETGEWRDATAPRTTTSVQAVRFCAKTNHYAELGQMGLNWTPRN